MMNRYGKYLIVKELIPDKNSHAINRIRMRKYKRIPKFYDYSILKRSYLVIHNSNNFTNEEKLYILLMINHGTNMSEMLAINFTDIDWEERTIEIRAGRRKRVLFLQQIDLIYLTKYVLEKRGNLDLNKSFKLFQNNGKDSTNHHIRKALKKLSDSLNINITQTGLRNTFILYLIDLNMDIIYIKEYFGLKSFSSLIRFEYVSISYLNTALESVDLMRSKLITNPVKTNKTNKANNVFYNIFEKEYLNNKITYNNVKEIK